MTATLAPKYDLGLDNIWHRKGRADVVPGASGGTGYTRPAADSTHVYWEAAHVGTEDLYHTLQRLTVSQKLILPEDGNGVPDLSNFKYGTHDGLRSNGTTGSPPSGLPAAKGLMGAGVGATTIKMVTNSNTITQAVAEASGTNQLFIMQWANCTGLELAGFTVVGTDQSNGGSTCKYYNGILIYKGSGGWVHDIAMIGPGPGWASAPPGETFLLDTNQHNNFLLEDAYFDGRLVNVNAASTPVGFNNSVGITVRRSTVNYCAFGAGFTQYQCDDIVYENCKTSNIAKPQINLERQGSASGGTAPLVLYKHTFDASGTCQIAITSDTGWCTLNIYDPIMTGGITQLHVRAYTTYAGNTSIQRSHLGAINCWVGGVWDPIARTYTGGTLRNDLLNVTT